MRKGSPGNVAAFRDFVLPAHADDSMSIVAISHGQHSGSFVVGVALVNTARGSMRVYEFVDPGFSILESVLVQESAHEALVSSGS